MDEKLKAAIEKTLERIPANSVKGDEAMKLSQAALYLSQVAINLAQAKQFSK